MAASSRAPYKVFISHAGEDKPTIAIPLREKLLSEQRIRAFVDERDMPGGTWSEPAMIAAMETADIAVVILSPEFVARKWPMKELLCFLRRSEEPQDDGRCLPIIIPLFYRLSIKELYDEPRLDRLDKNDKSLYRASRFFERMENGEPEANIANIKTALGKLHGAMGVENYVDASNESTNVMLKRRNVLLNDLCEQVQNAVGTISEEIPPDTTDSRIDETEFCVHYHSEDTVSDLVLDFGVNVNLEGNATTLEAAVLQAVLDRSEDKRVVSIQGIGGVGKTSILRGLSSLEVVKQRFQGGTHFISVGVDSTPNRLIDTLCKTVQASGGTQLSEEMRNEKDWKDVFKSFRSWFAEKECLFMIDDLWETSEITSGMIHELLKLHLSGMNSKVIVTTRSMEIASRAGKSFELLPREPQESQCRAILMLHSDTKVDERNKNAVTEILEKCNGLPLFLKLAGRAIKTLSLRHGTRGNITYSLYSRTLDVSMQGLLNMNVDSYFRLASSLSLSIHLLEDRKDRWGFPVHLSAEKIHRRLCVLESHSLVPMTMLRHLWELRSEAEAIVVAREFEQIALATMYVKETDTGYAVQLGTHDSLHEYACEETRKHGEETVGHKIVVEGYGRQLEIDEGCRAWWSEGLEADGYVHSNICRHLASARMKDELISLLLKPEWTIRLFEICGIRDLERSYSLGIRELKKVQDEVQGVRDERETRERVRALERALEMVSEATRLSVGYRIGSRRELCFQLYGRLKIYEEENVVLKDYLNRIEKKGEKICGRWLRCITPFMTPPGGPMVKLVKVRHWTFSMITSDDGNIVYCGCDYGLIIAVDTKSGDVVSEWRHDVGERSLGHVSGIALSNDQNLLCSASTDGMVNVRDLKAKSVLSRIVLPWSKYAEHTLAIGKGKLGISLYDGRMRLLDLENGTVLQDVFNARRGLICCMALFLDGEHLVCGGEDHTLEVWKTTRLGEQIGGAFVGHRGAVTCVSAMPDGRHIVSGSDDCTVRIWDISRRTQVGNSFEDHSGRIRSVAVSADGRKVVSRSLDASIRVWNVASGRGVCYRFGSHARLAMATMFHPTDDTVISCSVDGTIRFWDVSKPSTEINLDRHGDEVNVVTFTSSGAYAVSGSLDNSIRIWDASSGMQVGDPLLGHSEAITDMVITPDDRRIVSTSRDKTVRVWDLLSHAPLQNFTGHTDRINCISLTPSGGQAVTSSSDDTVRVWDLSGEEGGHFVLNTGCPESLGSIVDKSLDSYSVVFVTDDGLRVVSRFGLMISFKIIVWNLETRQVVHTESTGDNTYPPSSHDSRTGIMEAFGERTEEGVTNAFSIDSEGTLYHCGVKLGILEKIYGSWKSSPDNRTLCIGLYDGHVVFMKLEGGDADRAT